MRQESAEALGKIGGNRVIKSLIKHLANTNSKLNSLPPTLTILPVVKVAESLAMIGKEAVEPLINELENIFPLIKLEAAIALWKIGDRRALEPFLKCLHDECSDVRRFAAKALGEIGDRSVLEPFCGILNDNSEDVRNEASTVVSILQNLK